jgi:hypothetical protein
MDELSRRFRRVVVAGGIGLIVVVAPLTAVWAAAPLGACCLQNGSCADLVSFQCTDAGGDFIGDGTTCRTVRCDAPVAAPLLSIFGVVAACGALGGLGVYRLVFARR